MNRSLSSQEDTSSYLDLQSAMMQNEEREKLLRRMVEQQVELQQLQERQKALLDAQQQVSKLDFISTHDLQEKLERLQAVKHRISTLQSILDEAEASTEPASSLDPLRSSEGAGDNNAQRDDLTNASTLVNDQLEDLYATVTNLLSDIDKMNVLNDMADKQQLAALEASKPAASQKRSFPGSLDKTLSPLPAVKLVESNSSKLRHNLSQTSDVGDVNLVERHFYSGLRSNSKALSTSESSFDESMAMKKPVHELWSEMRRYQAQLAELQQRRRELTSYLKANEEKSGSHATSHRGQKEDDGYVQPNQTAKQNRKVSDVRPNIFPSMKYFMGDLKPADASTERTNATWGGSTSTSGDESEGSINQPTTTDTTVDAARGNIFSQLPDYVEEGVYKLWKELDYHNTYLQLLIDDQRALSVLLENTLSMQKDHHSTVMYGISPDFLIYQLDNCSAQIMVYRKQIVMLHKDLMEIQKQYPTVDLSYGFSRSVQNQSFRMAHKLGSLEDVSEFSPRNFSQKSTPMKYYTTESMRNHSVNESLNKVYQPYQRSPAAYFMKQTDASQSPQLILNKIKLESKSPGQMSNSETGPYVSITKAPMQSQQKASKEILMHAPTSPATLSKTSMATSATKSQPTGEVAKPEISDVDSNASGYPLFEALRDTIYSEAATLISQNEARPHFLIELFHELQQLNSDYLRQHCLFVIRDVVNGYIVETPKGVDEKSRKATGSGGSSKSKSVYTDLISSMKPLYSENTPSESEADSESENLPFRQSVKAPLQYDFALDVSNASVMTTPISSQEYHGSGDNNVQNPFEAEFLGSTVIHLDEAMQRVREMERLKQEKMEQGIDANEKELQQIDDKAVTAQLDAQKLDLKIKEIISEVIPVIKSTNDVCSEEKIGEISTLVSNLVAKAKLAEPKGDNVSQSNSNRQLQTVLNQCLNKFLGYHMSECGEEVILDISEVLFNELAYIYMIEDYEVIDEDQNKVDEAIFQNMVEEECSGRDQESQSVTTDMNDDSSTSSYTSSNSENKEDENETVTQMKQDTAEKNAAAVGDSSVIVDLSVSETKPLTSYGSGEDEEAGSGEEYDQYNESEDVPTSMQNDKITAPEKRDLKAETVSVNGVHDKEEA